MVPVLARDSVVWMISLKYNFDCHYKIEAVGITYPKKADPTYELGLENGDRLLPHCKFTANTLEPMLLLDG